MLIEITMTMKQLHQSKQIRLDQLVRGDLMILDSGDAITAGHVAGLAHGNPELVDISTLKVQHRSLLSKMGGQHVSLLTLSFILPSRSH